MSKKFWTVWPEGSSYPTSARYLIKEEVINEANRLARKTGAPCFVMESVGVAEPAPIPVEYTEY